MNKPCKDPNHKLTYRGVEITVQEWEKLPRALAEKQFCCELCYPEPKGVEWKKSEDGIFFIVKNHECKHGGFTPQGCSHCWDAMIHKEIHSRNESLIKKLDGMKGITKHPDFFTKLNKRLQGNIAMKGLDNFQVLQIAWEAKDLLIEEAQEIIRNQE